MSTYLCFEITPTVLGEKDSRVGIGEQNKSKETDKRIFHKLWYLKKKLLWYLGLKVVAVEVVKGRMIQDIF